MPFSFSLQIFGPEAAIGNGFLPTEASAGARAGTELTGGSAAAHGLVLERRMLLVFRHISMRCWSARTGPLPVVCSYPIAGGIHALNGMVGVVGDSPDPEYRRPAKCASAH